MLAELEREHYQVKVAYLGFMNQYFIVGLPLHFLHSRRRAGLASCAGFAGLTFFFSFRFWKLMISGPLKYFSAQLAILQGPF